MQRTCNALFGVLALNYAFFALSIVNRVWVETIVTGDSSSQLESFAAIAMVISLVWLALTVTHIVFLIIFARSIRDTRAASLASAAWILAIVQAVLGMGVQNLLNAVVSLDESTLPTVLRAVTSLVHWAHVGVFCASVYRLLADRRQPLSHIYAVGLVGSTIAMSLRRWGFDIIVLRPALQSGAGPSDFWIALSESVLWGLHLVWMGTITGFVLVATRRLRIAPQALRQIFD